MQIGKAGTVERVLTRGKECLVVYTKKEELQPAFGYAQSNVAQVREDLRPPVKRFVRAHEIYHLTDENKWGGWIGREIRANLIPALQDPIGFFCTVVESLRPERLKFYLNRFKEGH